MWSKSQRIRAAGFSADRARAALPAASIRCKNSAGRMRHLLLRVRRNVMSASAAPRIFRAPERWSAVPGFDPMKKPALVRSVIDVVVLSERMSAQCAPRNFSTRRREGRQRPLRFGENPVLVNSSSIRGARTNGAAYR